MSHKEPVLLIVLIETARLRWFVAALGFEGKSLTLLRSEDANIAGYLSQPLDHQLSFLRHRFAGALQRGADRLWARKMKPYRFVFVTDGCFIETEPELTQRLANHLVDWMVSPPVYFCTAQQGFSCSGDVKLQALAGELPEAEVEVLQRKLPELFSAIAEPDRWELVPKPRCS